MQLEKEHHSTLLLEDGLLFFLILKEGKTPQVTSHTVALSLLNPQLLLPGS